MEVTHSQARWTVRGTDFESAAASMLCSLLAPAGFMPVRTPPPPPTTTTAAATTAWIYPQHQSPPQQHRCAWCAPRTSAREIAPRPSPSSTRASPSVGELRRGIRRESRRAPRPRCRRAGARGRRCHRGLGRRHRPHPVIWRALTVAAAMTRWQPPLLRSRRMRTCRPSRCAGSAASKTNIAAIDYKPRTKRTTA